MGAVVTVCFGLGEGYSQEKKQRIKSSVTVFLSLSLVMRCWYTLCGHWGRCTATHYTAD